MIIFLNSDLIDNQLNAYMTARRAGFMLLNLQIAVISTNVIPKTSLEIHSSVFLDID